MQFVENKFSLPKFKPGHDLDDLGGCWYKHERKKILGNNIV
jgi:hypothetical protein